MPGNVFTLPMVQTASACFPAIVRISRASFAAAANASRRAFIGVEPEIGVFAEDLAQQAEPLGVVLILQPNLDLDLSHAVDPHLEGGDDFAIREIHR